MARAVIKSEDKPIVFVVDDDVSVRESLELLIQFAGWQPVTFSSAEEFLARPRVQTPGCLVLDVSLPDLNGLELQKMKADSVADLVKTAVRLGLAPAKNPWHGVTANP